MDGTVNILILAGYKVLRITVQENVVNKLIIFKNSMLIKFCQFLTYKVFPAT